MVALSSFLIQSLSGLSTSYGIAVSISDGATKSQQFSIDINNLVLENVLIAVVDTATIVQLYLEAAQ